MAEKRDYWAEVRVLGQISKPKGGLSSVRGKEDVDGRPIPGENDQDNQRNLPHDLMEK